MICSFFGHRKVELNKTIELQLKNIIIKLIHDGYKLFYFGGYGQFDKFCYNIVKSLQNEYSFIKKVFVRPYYAELQTDIIDFYLKDYEECIYLQTSNNFGKLKIIYRNFAIIDKSNFIIFFVNKKSGGANQAYKYAKRKNKMSINLADL